MWEMVPNLRMEVTPAGGGAEAPVEQHRDELDDHNGEEEEHKDDTDGLEVEVLLGHDDLETRKVRRQTADMRYGDVIWRTRGRETWYDQKVWRGMRTLRIKQRRRQLDQHLSESAFYDQLLLAKGCSASIKPFVKGHISQDESHLLASALLAHPDRLN